MVQNKFCPFYSVICRLYLPNFTQEINLSGIFAVIHIWSGHSTCEQTTQSIHNLISSLLKFHNKFPETQSHYLLATNRRTNEWEIAWNFQEKRMNLFVPLWTIPAGFTLSFNRLPVACPAWFSLLECSISSQQPISQIPNCS